MLWVSGSELPDFPINSANCCEDGKKAWDTVARAMVMRLAQKGDIHISAVVLLALGNAKDAVDIYVTHNMHM